MARYRVVAGRSGFGAQYWTGSGWSHFFWSAKTFAARRVAEVIAREIMTKIGADPKQRKQDWSTRKKNLPVISVEEIPYDESP